MLELLVTLFIGLLGGIAVGTQTPIAGAMSQRVGGAASSAIVHLGGFIASLALLISRGGENIAQWKELPWYMLGCGTLGLVLYLSISHTIPKLGVASALTLIIVGQLLVGLAIDHFGLFDNMVRSIGITKLIGVLLLFGGAYLIIR